jgi:glutathione S-transferase
MRIFFSPASPYVRKVMAVAIELGLDGRIEKLPSAVSPVMRDDTVARLNPLGKVPTLITDDGEALYDSRVICEYLAALAGDGRILPPAGPARWRALTEQAMADGMLDAALLTRYERMLRPAERQWDDWEQGQLAKVEAGLAEIEARAPSFGDRVDLGTIAIVCALSYLDFRFAHLDWRVRAPRAAAWHAVLDARPSLAATRPVDPNKPK